MASILIVDDEADIRGLLSDILKDDGYSIFEAGSASAAINIFNDNQIDLVILDIWLEGSEFDGVGVLKKLKSINSAVPIIMISGHGNIETAVQTIKAGAYDFIEKPFKSEKLMILISRALSAAYLQSENKELRQSLGHLEFVGDSKCLQALKEEAKTIATTKSRVLISGEAGCGKEAFARYIHQISSRKDRPFEKIIAGNVNDGYFEEEMFGSSTYAGILERVNGGTLFIDEVGQLDAKAQSGMLKILQENQFKKNSKQINLDIRFISSTTMDLVKLIEAEKFNQSLYYRLNVVPIQLPPLRDRKADIKPLCNLFLEYFATTLNMPLLEFDEEVYTHLSLHQWPGNVRQLKNLIEWLVIMFAKEARVITVDDMPKDLYVKSDNDNADNQSTIELNSEIISKPLRIARDIFERDYLRVQLSRFSGNISETAKFVGMERTALHRKIKALKVE